VAAFGAGVFVLGLICALLRIGRNAFRYAGITRAIVMLVALVRSFLLRCMSPLLADLLQKSAVTRAWRLSRTS
jgi:hypothetical protein